MILMPFYPVRKRPRYGFTLIEVMAVVLIVALLASAVVWSFAAPLRKTRFLECIEQIRQFDSSARHLARQGGHRVQVVINLEDRWISRRGEGMSSAGRLVIPSPLTLEEVRTAGRRIDGGEVTLECSPLGLSSTYAIKLAAADEFRWIMVYGLSGQVQVTDEAQVEKIFTAIAPRRDAD